MDIKAIIFDYFGVVRRDTAVGAQHDPELLNLILALRQKYKIGLLSNMGKGGLEVYWPKGEPGKYFDATIVSGEVGLQKPQPEMFEFAAKKLGVNPTQCIVADDNPSYCEGAKTVGMHAIWYRNFNQFKTELSTLLNQSEKPTA